jgi:DNA-binding MarR family transcriptional regulator
MSVKTDDGHREGPAPVPGEPDGRSPGTGPQPRSGLGVLAGGSVPSHRYDLQVLQALRRIMRATDLYSKSLAAEHQLTVPQLLCLLAIYQEEPLTATSIAKRVHLSASTVVGILDRLGAKGLVVRERGTEDRRIVNVTLSEKGRGVAGSAPSPLQERFVRAFGKLRREEQESIAAALQRIVELMEAKDLDAAPMLVAEQPLHGERTETEE